MKEETVEDIVADLAVGGATLSSEREFMENLFVGRFNYFLLVFSLFVTAGFANTFATYKSAVFFAGAFVLSLVWLCLYRAYLKHDRTMKIVFRKKEHPASQIERIIRLEGYEGRYRVSWLMGVAVPGACVSLMLAAALAISCDIIR